MTTKVKPPRKEVVIVVSIQRIINDYGDNICRRCINKKYHSKLRPEDCQYGYTYSCPVCKKIHNIVVGFSLKGQGKLLFK